MMETQVRRISICQSDEVFTQGTIAGSTAHETRHLTFGHPTMTESCLCWQIDQGGPPA